MSPLPTLTGSATLKPADVNPLFADIEARLAGLEQVRPVDLTGLTQKLDELAAAVAKADAALVEFDKELGRLRFTLGNMRRGRTR